MENIGLQGYVDIFKLIITNIRKIGNMKGGNYMTYLEVFINRLQKVTESEREKVESIIIHAINETHHEYRVDIEQDTELLECLSRFGNSVSENTVMSVSERIARNNERLQLIEKYL